MSAPVVHPSWCDSARCEATLSQAGAHTSKPAVVPADAVSTARVQLRLWQPIGEHHRTYLELAVGDHRDGHRARVDLSLAQARRVRFVLVRLLDAARAGAR